MKHKKGFTLIEVVVVIVLTSVLLAGLVPILPAAQKQVYRTQNVTAAAQSGESIYKYIVDTLDGADRIWIGDNDTNKPSDPENWNTFTVQNGLLLLNDSTVYDQDYQRGCMLTLSANGSGRTSIQLGIELTKITGEKSEVLYTQNSAFSPARMNTSSFACIEGSIGTQIATMSYSADGINTQSDAPQLVIYFQMAQNNPVPTFTPSTNPEATLTPSTPAPIPTLEPVVTAEPEPTPSPTPNPSGLYVSLPDKLVINVGDSRVPLIPKVTVPQNVYDWELTYSWNGLDNNSNISVDRTWNWSECYITGKAVTEQLVTLTVSYTRDNITYSASASCTIIVEAVPIVISDLIDIRQGRTDTRDNMLASVSNDTIFININDTSGDLEKFLSFKAYGPQNLSGNENLSGTWSIAKHLNSNGEPTTDLANSRHDWIWEMVTHNNREGIIQLVFTADGKTIQSNKYYSELKGKSSIVTIVFYKGENLTQNSEIIKINHYFTHPDATNDRKSLAVGYQAIRNSFTDYVFTVDVVATGESGNIIRQKLDEEPTVQISGINAPGWGDLLDYNIINRWEPYGQGNSNLVLKPLSTKLIWSASENLYKATTPIFFNADNTTSFGSYCPMYNIYTWVYTDDTSANSNKKVWFNPFSQGLNPKSQLTIKPNIELYRSNTTSEKAVVQDNTQKWVGLYSPNLANQTVFVEVNQDYILGGYTTENLQNNRIYGSWSILRSVNGAGEYANSILNEQTQNAIKSSQGSATFNLTVTAQSEGIVTLRHTASGSAENGDSFNGPLKDTVSDVTFIFYDAEKVVNGTSELLKSTLTLTSNSGQTGLDSLTTAYTAEGNKIATAVFTLDVVPKWNWDDSKVNVEEIIRNALERNPPNVSLSTRLNSMSSWSDFSSIAKPQPNTVPLIASSKSGTYQAAFPLSFSNYVPTADLTTSLYAWIWTEDSTILDGIHTLFNPTLPNRCTITVEPPIIDLYTGETKTANAKPIGSILEIAKSSELAFSAYNFANQQLMGIWEIKNDSTSIYKSQSAESFCPKSEIKKLNSGSYTVSFTGSDSPYSARTVSFTLVVKAATTIVAYKMDYSQASDPTTLTEYSNLNPNLTVFFGDTLNLYSYLRTNGGAPKAVSGTWTIRYENGDPAVFGTTQTFSSVSSIALTAITDEYATKDFYTVSITFEPSNTSNFSPTDSKSLSLTVTVKKSAFDVINRDLASSGATLTVSLPESFLPGKKFRWWLNDTIIYNGEPYTVTGIYGKHKQNGKNLCSYSVSTNANGEHTIVITKLVQTGNGNLNPYTLILQYSDDGKLWTTYDSINFRA